jgi:hypothetical protein
MHDSRRLEQLHVLIDRLERLPASPHRDWMLLEVRARAVDVESDVRPTPIRRFEPEPPAAAPEAATPAPPQPRAAASHATPARPARARGSTPSLRATTRTGWARSATHTAGTPARARAPFFGQASLSHDRVDLLIEGGRLCLDDRPLERSEADRHASSLPWAQGLRG